MTPQVNSAFVAMLLIACGGPPPPDAANSAESSVQPPASAEHAHGHTASPPEDESSKPSLQTKADEPQPTTPPSPEVLPNSSAAEAAATANRDNATLTVTVRSTLKNAAKDAVVYLTGTPKGNDVPGTLDNRQMAFTPHILVVTAGSTVKFTNSDPFPHNVFSPDHEKWDMGVIPAHGTRSRKFETAGVYTALCNMHPNMKAYIVVTPSSYFAKADKAGTATIGDVPTGKYKVVIWAPGAKQAEQDITLDSNRSLAVDLNR